LNLLKTGSTTVTIGSDDSSLEGKLNEAVDAFNNFNDFVQGQMKLPASGSRPPLATDALLRSLNRQIRSYLTSNHANSGDLHNLASLGVRLNRNGKLEIDKSALTDALSTDPEGVKAFLSDVSGLAAKVSNYVDSLVAGDGSIDAVETRIQATVDNYTRRIAALEQQLALREEVLTRQFAAADQAISQLNSQANALTSLGSQYRLF
jgi:flagellar hook-associated protein 2